MLSAKVIIPFALFLACALSCTEPAPAPVGQTYTVQAHGNTNGQVVCNLGVLCAGGHPHQGNCQCDD